MINVRNKTKRSISKDLQNSATNKNQLGIHTFTEFNNIIHIQV
jgi:hypothetical protein